MTSERRTTLPLPKTSRVWTNTLTLYGTYNGSAKAKATKVKA